MNRLLFVLLLLTLSAGPVIADEEITDETTEETTDIIENAEYTETLTNQMTNTTSNTQNAELKTTKPRNKWDFSDHPEDKAKKDQASGKRSSIDRYGNKRPETKPREKWIDKDTNLTKKSVTTNNVKTTKK